MHEHIVKVHAEIENDDRSGRHQYPQHSGSHQVQERTKGEEDEGQLVTEREQVQAEAAEGKAEDDKGGLFGKGQSVFINATEIAKGQGNGKDDKGNGKIGSKYTPDLGNRPRHP
jgi:hypothetical protein